MANKGPAYGLSLETANKIAGKRNVALETEVLKWVEQVTGKKVSNNNGDYSEDLKDGLILIELVNKLRPNTVKKYNKTPKMPFVKMENIGFFLEGIKSVGVGDLESFMTVDLFEAKNMVKVTDTLAALKKVVG